MTTKWRILEGATECRTLTLLCLHVRQPVLVLGRDLPECLTLVADMSIRNSKTKNGKLSQFPGIE